MAKFYGTFGQGHKLGRNYVAFEAPDMQEAHIKMIQTYGYLWSFIYSEDEFKNQPKDYGITEVEFGTPNERI